MSEKIELQSEDNFRNTKNPKKRVKYLTEYCHDLLKKGHMVEAKYFVDKLIEINPNHPKALKLAYEIAVNMNDYIRVKDCDQKLLELKKVPVEDVMSLQIEYYVKNNAELALCNLCKEGLYQASKLEDKAYAGLIHFAIEKKNFFILFNALNHLRRSNLRKKIVFKKDEPRMKKILVMGILEILRDIHE